MSDLAFSELLSLFERARSLAIEHNRPILAVTSLRTPKLDPLCLYEAYQEGFFWRSHTPDLTLFGLGCELTLQAQGVNRIGEIDRQWADICRQALVEGERPGTILGGMRFDEQRESVRHWSEFADASFHLAHLLVSEDSGGRWLRCQRMINATSDPATLARDSLLAYEQLTAASRRPAMPAPRVIERTALPAPQWQAKVEKALQAIACADLSKVVLARHVQYQLDTVLSSGSAIRRLYDQGAQSHLFAIHRGHACFLGATPERLVSCQSGQLATHALAGSARRGATPDEDKALGKCLLTNNKEHHEHRLVVQTISEGLRNLVSDLHVAPQPNLLKLVTVQHLSTPIHAQLHGRHGLLDVVQALHPTPAVGGLESAAALKFIRMHEGFDRGWYAAPVGWLDSQGNGDFLVALRSALITDQNCHLFAGCGIVNGSLPADEYEETQIKLTSMEHALQLVLRPQ